MDIKRLIDTQMRTEQRLRKKYISQLEKLPEGRLTGFRLKGKVYYKWIKGGKTKYIGAGNRELVEKLQLRRYLEKLIATIDRNAGYLRELWEKYRPVAPEEILGSLPKTYRNRRLLTLAGQGADLREWEESDYEQSAWHREYKVHLTAKGDLVRSKSELIIADMLYEREIPYHYEEVLHMPDGGYLVPDFTIGVRDTGRLVYLEPCGMLSEEHYRRDYLRKMERYCVAGFRPWIDVYFTFDNANGALDTDKIGRMMDVMF